MIREKLILQEAASLHQQLALTDRWVDVEAAINLNALRLDRVSTLPKGMRGHYDQVQGIIRVLGGLPDVEERFACAHELGHHVLNHGDKSCFDVGLLGGSAPIEELDIAPNFEQEAHAFARELLLPRRLFRNDLLAGLSPNDLAPLYGVSVTAIWIQFTKMRLPAAHRKVSRRQPKGTPLNRKS